MMPFLLLTVVSVLNAMCWWVSKSCQKGRERGGGVAEEEEGGITIVCLLHDSWDETLFIPHPVSDTVIPSSQGGKLRL